MNPNVIPPRNIRKLLIVPPATNVVPNLEAGLAYLAFQPVLWALFLFCITEYHCAI
jgi:hypothetical protein